jgi:putative transposase
VNPEFLLQNKYLATENPILRANLLSRLRLSDPECATLAEIGGVLGHKLLREVAGVSEPDTIPARYRGLVAKNFAGSKHQQYPGRPTVQPGLSLILFQRGPEIHNGVRPRGSRRGS